MGTSGLPSLPHMQSHMQCTCAPSHTHTCTHSGYISHLTIFSHLKEAQACPYEAIRGQMTNTGVPGAASRFQTALSPSAVTAVLPPGPYLVLTSRTGQLDPLGVVWYGCQMIFGPYAFFLVKPLLLRQCHLIPGLAFGA